MKSFLPCLLLLLIVSCKDRTPAPGSNADLFKTSFSDHHKVDLLKDYEKISDTVFFTSDTDPSHRILELKKEEGTLILFLKISLDKERREHYSILDTLHISDPDPDQVISIGYCELGNFQMEEIIALVERADTDTIRNIVKAWRANPESSQIEPIPEVENMFCYNEVTK